MSDYFSQDIFQWNAEAIHDRAAFLSDNVVAVWPALAAMPVAKEHSATKPVALTIQGQSFAVLTWTDVLRQTGEFVAQVSTNFETIVANLPSFLAKEPFNNRSFQLSNGWWLYINLSTKEIKRVCGRLLQAAGIPASDWAVTEAENGGEDRGEDTAEQQKGEAANFNDACAKLISEYLGVPLIKQGGIHYASPDNHYRVVCSVSKAYARLNETGYWYAFHPAQDTFLSESGAPFVAYGCGLPDKIVLIPYQRMLLVQLTRQTMSLMAYSCSS